MKDKPKAIEHNGNAGIMCDNPKCNYIDKTISDEDMSKWINKPCPKCGENLLTLEDYEAHEVLLSIIEIANAILPSPEKGDDMGTIGVHYHAGKLTIDTKKIPKNGTRKEVTRKEQKQTVNQEKSSESSK